METNAAQKNVTMKLGVVISDKMNKTIVVRVDRRGMHPGLGKVMNQSSKFKVHDEKNEAKVGDIVKIVLTRPISKEKRFRLLEIVKKQA